ncbi:MAG TPA: XRE family transcriptional regulator [bacterium]|nr:XRE family transcriptional regulator [bacterium]
MHESRGGSYPRKFIAERKAIGILFRKNVVFYRNKAGLRQIDLAEKMDVAQSLVSRWGSQKYTDVPTAYTLLHLSQVLKCTVNDLLIESRPI